MTDSAKSRTTAGNDWLPSRFRSYFGNYYVAGLRYRRSIRAVVSAGLSTTASKIDVQIATKASASLLDIFGGGGGFNSQTTFEQLSKIGSVYIEISAEGTKLYSGRLFSAGDVQALRDAITDTVKTWTPAPKDPTQLGTVEAVWLRGYQTLQPALSQPPPTLPDANALNTALSKYTNYSQYRWRIAQHLDPANIWHPKITNYLLAKATELDKLLAALKAYTTDLLKQKDVPDPTKGYSFEFQDPEQIRWRLLKAWVRADGYAALDFEVIGNVDLDPTTGNQFEIDYLWQFKFTPGKGLGYTWSGGQPRTNAFKSSHNKITGTSTRYIRLLLPKGSHKTDQTVSLLTKSGLLWTFATGADSETLRNKAYIVVKPQDWVVQ